MTRPAIFTALTTGGFCSLFALGVDLATEMLTWWQILVVGGISGFCGSLFAHFVLGRRP